MATGLHSLANEVIEQILDYNITTSTLHSLVLSSRSLYKVFIPYLYRDVDVENDRYSNKLRCLCSALVRNLDLAANVRTLRFRDYIERGEDDNDDDNNDASTSKTQHNPSNTSLVVRIANQDWQSLLRRDKKRSTKHVKHASLAQLHKDVLEACGVHDIRRFHDVQLQPEHGALLPFLLSLMSNLSKIDIQLLEASLFFTFESTAAEISRATERLQSDIHTCSFLATLREINLAIHPEQTLKGIEICQHFMRSPNMRIVRLRGLPLERMHTDCDTYDGLDMPAGSSNVIHLEFRESSISLENIMTFVRACRGLTTLIYEHPSVYWSGGRLFELLRAVTSTIEVLWLGLGCYVHQSVSLNWSPPPDTSRLRLENVKCLRLPLRFLDLMQFYDIGRSHMIPELMPPSLESLHILYAKLQPSKVRNVLNSWDVECSTHTPHLRTFIIDTMRVQDKWAMCRALPEFNGAKAYFRDHSLQEPGRFVSKGWGWYEEFSWGDDPLAGETLYRTRRRIFSMFGPGEPIRRQYDLSWTRPNDRRRIMELAKVPEDELVFPRRDLSIRW
jgi:hypothetical protein